MGTANSQDSVGGGSMETVRRLTKNMGQDAAQYTLWNIRQDMDSAGQQKLLWDHDWMNKFDNFISYILLWWINNKSCTKRTITSNPLPSEGKKSRMNIPPSSSSWRKPQNNSWMKSSTPNINPKPSKPPQKNQKSKGIPPPNPNAKASISSFKGIISS